MLPRKALIVGTVLIVVVLAASILFTAYLKRETPTPMGEVTALATTSADERYPE